MPASLWRLGDTIRTVSQTRTVYVGDRTTLEQVEAAVKAWQEQAGDTTGYDIEALYDAPLGMGTAIDIDDYFGDEAQLAARDLLAEGIKPLLTGMAVMTDTEVDAAERE